MPELPEVEYSRKLLHQYGVGRTIRRITCADDGIVFSDQSGAAVSRALKGRVIKAAHRRGKHLIVEFDKQPFLLIHFGMTGQLWIRGHKPLRLRSSSSNEAKKDWPPKFTKLAITLDDGTEFAVTNKRRLGRIRLRDDPWNTPPIDKLGFDPLHDLPSAKKLGELLSKRSGPMKAVLLDQSFAAGVGNWVADEILYQAKISPKRRADTLSSEQIKRLRASIRSVCQTAVAREADSSRYPRTWLFHVRWGGGKSGSKTARGEAVRRESIAGRTTAWVPSVQT